MKKIAADLIATEMYKLLKKASVNEVAEMTSKNKDMVDDAEDMANDEEDMANDSEMSDDAEDNLADFLMKEEEDFSDDEGYVDNEIMAMQNMASDNLMRDTEGSNAMAEELKASASDMRLMTGLGKIEASLRRKGEDFAADLVRTTAISIKEDIVKEASKKDYVVKNLVKMASDLERKGERKASSLVRSTIMKINR